jgi:hypothetical protein
VPQSSDAPQTRSRLPQSGALPASASDPRVARVLLRIPSEIRQSMTAEQINAVCAALLPQGANPNVHDIRLSVRAFRANYFLRILWGPERRSLARLEAEGQLKFGRHLALFLLLCWSVTTLLLIVVAGLLYFYKSYVGIEFFPGPSIIDRCFGW